MKAFKLTESLKTDSCPSSDCVPHIQHLQLKGERFWGGDFNYLKKFVEEGRITATRKMVITRQHGEGVQNHHTKLTLTWYHGKNQTLSLQGEDSPALKVKLINLVHS